MSMALRLPAEAKDLGGFSVRRLLPHPARRMVGPFVFFDHIGPADFPPGQGIEVRAHPHIGLATVTYLFEGALRHRDSLGTVRDIGPGAVNWMTAGRGIVHSERTPPELRAAGHRIHGIQTWVALPKTHEEMPPAFAHWPADAIPEVALDGGRARVIAGSLWGRESPVSFPHPILYAELKLEGGRLPLEAGWGERALYLVSGRARLAGEAVEAGDFLVLADGHTVLLEASGTAHAMLCGGAAMDGPRTVWWNLVASDPAKIEAAKADWAADPFGGRFGPVPDEEEFIPLPG